MESYMQRTKKKREEYGLCKTCGKLKERADRKNCDSCIKEGSLRKLKSRKKLKEAKEGTGIKPLGH